MNKFIYVIVTLNLLINTSCFLGNSVLKAKLGWVDEDILDSKQTAEIINNLKMMECMKNIPWNSNYEKSGFIYETGSSRRKGINEGKYQQAIAYALWDIQYTLNSLKKRFK